MQVKGFIKRITPVRWHSPLRSFFVKLGLFSYYWGDFRHLFAPLEDAGVSRAKYRARLIKQYHRIEKALAVPTFTPGRGSRAAEDLVGTIQRGLSAGIKKEDIQMQAAVRALSRFLSLQGSEASELRRRFDNVCQTSDIKVTEFDDAGTLLLEKQYFIDAMHAPFALLSARRHSIREFERSAVPIDKIFNAVQIAQRTPSVCNRQGWHVFVLTKDEHLQFFKTIHNGFARREQYLSTLLIVCFDRVAFDYPVERNQGFVDGGLFSMSLMYALTHLGLASCPLNANITKRSERDLRDLIGLTDQYGLVMFIAVGNYSDSSVVPASLRDGSHQEELMTIV